MRQKNLVFKHQSTTFVQDFTGTAGSVAQLD